MVPVASAFKSSFVYSGSAIVNGVNMITPHLAGAVDILAVKQPDGSLKSTPFYVRFGKYTSYRAKEKTVNIVVNGSDDDEEVDEINLSGMMTPPSGYSSAEDDVPYATEKLIKSIKSKIQDKEEDTSLSKNENTISLRYEVKVDDENGQQSYLQQDSVKNDDLSINYQETMKNGLKPLLVDSLDLTEQKRMSMVENKCLRIKGNELKKMKSERQDIHNIENKESQMNRTESCPNLKLIEEQQSLLTSMSNTQSLIKVNDNEVEIIFEPPNEINIIQSQENSNGDEMRKTRSEPDEENSFRFPETFEWYQEKTMTTPLPSPPPHNTQNEEDGYMGDNDNEDSTLFTTSKEEINDLTNQKNIIIKEEVNYNHNYEDNDNDNDNDDDDDDDDDDGLAILKGFELSLCGHLLTREMSLDERKRVFENHRVTRDVFEKDGIALTNDPHLVCRWSGTVYPWSAVAPMVLGVLAFGSSGHWDNLIQSNEDINKDKSNITTNNEDKNDKPRISSISSSGWSLWPFGSWREQKTSKSPEIDLQQNFKNDDEDDTLNQRQMHKREEMENEMTSNEAISNEAVSDSMDMMMLNERSSQKKHRIVTKKTLLPTSEQLAACNFVDGQNTIHFNIGDSVKIQAYVYVIDWTSKLVISDIDGTVTKSDILGHLLPQMGFDWTHPGVAHLLSNIKSNGYEVISRAIAQANITRDFLHRITQEGYKMPSGPVIISPHGILPSLYREIILRRPHDFKISSLQDIRILFPKHWNPFYAGFGNRDTDVFSYEKSGVPLQRIFTINSKGQIVLGTTSSMQTSTWSSLQSINELVDEVFPPTIKNEAYAELREEFNDYHYWKFSNDTWLWHDDPKLHDIEYNYRNRNFLNQNYLDKDDMDYFPGQLARSVLDD